MTDWTKPEAYSSFKTRPKLTLLDKRMELERSRAKSDGCLGDDLSLSEAERERLARGYAKIAKYLQ